MNRFYLFFAIFLIQFIGFAQIQLSVVEGTQTNYCLSSNQPAQLLVSVDSPIQGINGSDIEYIVLDSFANVVDSGNFNNSFQKIIFFSEPGDYFIFASAQDFEDSSPILFTVYPSLAEIEISPLMDNYYLCDGNKEINLEILNDSLYENTSIIANSESTYNSLNGQFIGYHDVSLLFNSPDIISSIQFIASDSICTITKEINDIHIFLGPTSETSSISQINTNPVCFNSGTDNIVNLSVNDSEFNISNFNPTFDTIFVSSSPISLQGVYVDSISINYDSIGCSIINSYEINYGINYNTEFVVEKILSDGSISEYNGVLCNNEKIKLTNTSIHFSDCPECFEWSISGSPTDLVINSESGSVTFSYTEDVFDDLWTLSYTDSNNICSDIFSVQENVNVDFIDVNIEVLPTSICNSTETVELESISAFDDSGYTYSWNLNNNNGTIISASNSESIVTLPNPGLYDIGLEITTLMGCSETYTESNITSVLGDTEFVVEKILSDGSISEYNGVLCNNEKIKLTNTSIHFSDCPECFEWSISGSPTDLVINSESGSVTFSYTEDVFDDLWTLSYTDSNNICSDIFSVQENVNVDFIDVNIEVLPTSICNSTETVELESISAFDDSGYTYSWNLNNNNGTIISASNSESIVTLPNPGLYDIGLEITTSTGCSQEFLESDIIEFIVEIPLLNFISWTDTGMIINFSENQDDRFSHLEVWHQRDDEFSSWLSVNLNIDSLYPNYFVHEIGSPGLSELTFANNYYLKQYDTCGYESDLSIIHSSILLETNSYEYQEIELSWSRYRGWDNMIVNQMIVPDTVDIIYEVYRSENNIDFERIITVIDTLPYLDQGFKFVDKDLCNIDYTYYVLAKHSEIEDFKSRSNKSIKQPNFVDFTKPLNLSYTTVNIFGDLIVNGEFVENYTLTEWEELDQSDMNYYKVDRFDNYYGWKEEFKNVTDSTFLDFNADINNDEYIYRVSYWDDCGNEGPESNLGSNILLHGIQTSTHYDLNWNSYIGWDFGVQNYIIEYYQSQNNIWVELDIVSGTTNDYRDSDLQKNDLSDSYDLLHGVDTSYCYRVRAISYLGYESQSNEFCFIAEHTNYFPNAFSPNNDGINDYFEYKFRTSLVDDEFKNSSFVKSINLQIFNKWGNLVFETNDLDFKWDGTIQNNGEDCPQGAYILSYDLRGYNGSVISDKGMLYLLR